MKFDTRSIMSMARWRTVSEARLRVKQSKADFKDP